MSAVTAICYLGWPGGLRLEANRAAKRIASRFRRRQLGIADRQAVAELGQPAQPEQEQEQEPACHCGAGDLNSGRDYGAMVW